MRKVEVTKIDGTTEIIGGELNDKLFARYAPVKGWVSYRNFDDGVVPEMTAKEKELKDYCDHNDRVRKAMSY